MIRYFFSDEAKELGARLSLPRASDAGLDLPSLFRIEIAPQGFVAVPTGLHLAIPDGWVGLVKDRSSIALRGVITVAGVIDSSYRGEVKVLMRNLSDVPVVLEKGERIAQVLVIPHFATCDCQEVESLDELGQTDRGLAGFGSTGRFS